MKPRPRSSYASWRAFLVLACFGACGDGGGHRDIQAKEAGSALALRENITTPWASWGGSMPALDRDWEPSFRKAEVERRSDAPALVEGLDDADPRVRTRAAWALGRIGGVQAMMRLAAALDDSVLPVEPAWIAALGFLQPPRSIPGEPPEPEGAWQTLVEQLWMRYALTEDFATAEALLLAIARNGGRRTQRLLAVELAELPMPDERRRYRAAMEASAIVCARGHALERAGLNAIGHALLSTETELRKGAAYALSRCAMPSAEVLAGSERGLLVERLSPMVRADDAEEARLAWRALGALGEIADDIPARILGDPAPAWLVELEAVSAMGNHADGRRTIAERLAAFPLDDLEGPRVHVLIAALRGLRRASEGSPELLGGVDAFVRRVQSLGTPKGRRAKVVGLVLCELRFLQALRSGDIEPLARCSDEIEGIPESHAEALCIDALLVMGSSSGRAQKLDALLQRARDVRARVAAPAITALSELDDSRIDPLLRDALQRDDTGIKAAAASAIAVRSMDAARRNPAMASLLIEAVRELENGSAIEARLAAIEALGHLARPRPMAAPREGADTKGRPPWLEEVLVPLAKDPAAAVRTVAREALLGHEALVARFDDGVPPAFPDAFDPAISPIDGPPDAVGLRLHTDAGIITIEFTGVPAPLMHGHLVRLANEGYFDGLTFHRVAPGFVIQGGDPRGDGYGGPGWLVPCEWSNLRYERGVVGVALAGKDTGGSQLFITQAPGPHLDARYTVVGRVTEGMEAVDRMLIYDRIVRVEVLR